MNRLAVGWSARAQQAHKLNNRINWLMPLLKTDTDTQTNGSTSYKVLFWSRQTHTQIDRYTLRDPNPRSAEDNKGQTDIETG